MGVAGGVGVGAGAAGGVRAVPPRAQFYGHNPNLKLPPDLFLLGCVFHIVSINMKELLTLKLVLNLNSLLSRSFCASAFRPASNVAGGPLPVPLPSPLPIPTL